MKCLLLTLSICLATQRATGQPVAETSTQPAPSTDIFNRPPRENLIVYKLEAKDDVKLGEDLSAKVTLTSRSNKVEEVGMIFSIASLKYTTEDIFKVLNTTRSNVVLNPGEKKEFSWTIPVEIYADKLYPGLPNEFFVRFDVSGTVKSNGEKDHKRVAKKLIAPPLTATQLNKSTGVTTMEIAFDNPLPIVLNNCYLSLSGWHDSENKQLGRVSAYGHLRVSVDVLEEKPLIAAILICDEMKGMRADLLSE